MCRTSILKISYRSIFARCTSHQIPCYEMFRSLFITRELTPLSLGLFSIRLNYFALHLHIRWPKSKVGNGRVLQRECDSTGFGALSIPSTDTTVQTGEKVGMYRYVCMWRAMHRAYETQKLSGRLVEANGALDEHFVIRPCLPNFNPAENQGVE